MLKARIIPCLDVDRGRVVKGVNFVDLVDAGDPVEQARIYDREGADELCFLDITASHEDRDTIFDVVGHTAEQCFMPLTVGGGVRTTDDIRKLLLAGAVSTPVIAAGGVSSMAELRELKEAAEGALEGVISGRAIYDGHIDPAAAAALLRGAPS